MTPKPPGFWYAAFVLIAVLAMLLALALFGYLSGAWEQVAV
jgi:hypothetical protein